MTPGEERLESQRKESERLAAIAEVRRLQEELQRGVSNEQLIMLGLAELIAFMPKSEGSGETREALYRELWRRGAGVDRLERGR